jgi:hypothetical protein
MLTTVIPTQGERRLLALTFTTLAVPVCAGAHPLISAGAADLA